MQTILEIITNYCKNYGSYISLADLKSKWLTIPPEIWSLPIIHSTWRNHNLEPYEQ